MHAKPRPSRALRHAVIVALLYALLSLAWIILSDDLASVMAADKQAMTLISSIKGVAFVLAMALLVGLLIYRTESRRYALEDALNGLRRDHVTGMPNRMHLEAVLDEHAATGRERLEPFGVILVDLINLERINISLGRSGGDAVLREAARRLREALRTEDFVARLESDKFVVVLSPPTDESATQGAAHRIIAAFERPFDIDGIPLKIDLYVGISLAPEDGHRPQALLDAAGRAVRHARARSRKNTLTLHHEADVASSTLELEGELRVALASDRLEPFFQPLVALPGGEVVGAEALARWRRADDRFIPPGEFIPVAESAGLIGEITERMLERVMITGMQWQRQGAYPIRLSVNLSGFDLDGDRIVHIVSGLVDRTGFPAKQLVLELTESRFMENPESAIAILKRLRALGLRIAIDDFGTGYSSLSYLTRFPVDTIKIDRAFVHKADTMPEKRAVLQAICGIARALGLETVAEGVETRGEARLVQEMGCHRMQGYLASPPVSADDFSRAFLGRDTPVKLPNPGARESIQS
ncbi:MAG TPA: bifunctional diguanylate cyclase/phosphodiesterase [Gammaproteobacteria bacterium]|nr:bifunctional diguanylate cyclase/phosphodiesterase [Gammaproteobacteria bacterium]